MDFLITTDSQTLLQSVATFASEAGVNPNALKNTLRGTLLFLKGATRKNLSPQLLTEDLTRFGVSCLVGTPFLNNGGVAGLDASKAEAIAAQWRTRVSALSRTKVDQTFLINKLVDIEWRFGG